MKRRCRTSIGVQVLGLATLVMALPLVSSGSELTNTFLTSTSGTSTIDVGDTIQFEVSIRTNASQTYDTILCSVTGDAAAAVGSTKGSGWGGVSQMATNWSWNYKVGTGSVDFGTVGTINPTTGTTILLPTPDRVAGNNGFLITSTTGTGSLAVVGTVTIAADTPGNYQGGAFLLPGVDGFMNLGVVDAVSVSTAAFTVTGGAVPMVPAMSDRGVVVLVGILLTAAMWFARGKSRRGGEVR